MGNDTHQPGLFPAGDNDLPEEPHYQEQPIASGDWLYIEHEDRTVIGMVYRRQDENYMFVYWDNLVLRFGATTRDHIGPWHAELTAIFRGQMAVIPNYVEQCVADWVMQPVQHDQPRRGTLMPRPLTSEPPAKVQKRLFPE